jgi:(E)-4-hydroxy-3-methylbut-2-enyl-diphosphate synthase
MTTTRTWDIDATVGQINQLHIAGCDIIRVACPTNKDAKALQKIVELSPIPVIADIHFQPTFVYQALQAGCPGVRVNPGNIKNLKAELPRIVAMAKDTRTSMRIGVNAGSLAPDLLEKYNYKVTPEAIVEAALREAREFEKLYFYDFAISVKHHDPLTTVEAYQLLSQKGDWPFHLGVTEAGPALQGTVKSAVAFGILLKQGIGDTIRVSLSADPIEEVKVGLEILYALRLRERRLEIISCPTCGRKEADVISLAAKVEDIFMHDPELKNKKLKVAVMGCIVNGPGEAREADLGVAGGRGKGEIFIKGKSVKTVEESQIISELVSIAKSELFENL